MRQLVITAILVSSIFAATQASAELNWKSGGVPSVSCEVTYIRTEWPFNIGEWRELKLTYHITEEPGAKLNYRCEAKFVKDIDGNYFNCRDHECKLESSTPGSKYGLRGNNADLELQPGVNKLDACQRLYKNAGIWVDSQIKQ